MEGVTFRSGTFGEVPTVTEVPTETQAVAVETTDADITTELAAEAVATETTETVAEQTPVDESVSDFKIEGFDTPTTAEETPATQAPTQPTIDWRDAIKTVDKKELAKELGLDDFDLEFVEYRKRGGDPSKYLEAKSFDWNKVNDIDVVKAGLKNEFPTLNNEQINKLFEKKYSQNELADDDDREMGSILLQAEAHKLRQAKIEEQQRFKLPEPIQQQQTAQVDNSAKEQAEYNAKINQFFATHEQTQNLINSKRVAIDLGDAGQFNFNVDRPEMLLKAITDGQTWQKITATPQGEPDVQKLLKIAKYAFNPDAHDKALFNYGKSFGLKGIVKEGQNAKRPEGQMPTATNITEAEAWKTQAKPSKFGA